MRLTVENTSTLGKIIIALTSVPQYWGLLLDVITKISQPDFARELAKFARKQACWVGASIISIVRGRFNPVEFVGEGWNIIADETDTRSIALTELDLTKVELRTMLKDGETSVKGEEKLKRLKASGLVRLDAEIFLTLWENQHPIPESWKEKVNGNTRYIFFDGTVLRDSYGLRYVLCLYWDDGGWHWGVYWLDFGWDVYGPSAVLAS